MSKSNSKNVDSQNELVRELFHQNEIKANKLVILTMLLLSIGLLFAWIFIYLFI